MSRRVLGNSVTWCIPPVACVSSRFEPLAIAGLSARARHAAVDGGRHRTDTARAALTATKHRFYKTKSTRIGRDGSIVLKHSKRRNLGRSTGKGGLQ